MAKKGYGCSLLVGAALGGALAAFFMSEKGEKLRTDITNKANELWDEHGKEKFDEVSTKVMEKVPVVDSMINENEKASQVKEQVIATFSTTKDTVVQKVNDVKETLTKQSEGE